jgi:parvulin-like peptidyl-prolyl isomerase
MKLSLLLVILSLFLASCSNNNEMNIPESEVIAVVGDEKITQDLLNAFLNANGILQTDKDTVTLALDALISEVAMSNIATKKKLPFSAEQLNTLKYLQIRTQSKNAQLDYLSKNQISDEEIQKEYDKANQQTGGVEFYVHHLLFKDEIQARELFDQIHSPEDYLIQEQNYLKTNTKMKNVGELGWVSLSQLPQSFKDTLLITEKNTVVTEVVNSPFGAHIIYLKDTRILQAPSLEEVKKGIIQSLTNQKISNFKQLAKAKAHVMIKE